MDSEKKEFELKTWILEKLAEDNHAFQAGQLSGREEGARKMAEVILEEVERSVLADNLKNWLKQIIAKVVG